MNFNNRVETLSGVGKAMVIKLGRLGVETIGDLLAHYPRRYDDFSDVIPIRLMKPGLVTFRGNILQIVSRRARSRRLSITEAIISDHTGTIKAIWFNQPFLTKSFPVGSKVLVSGKLEFKNNDLALQGPAIELDDGDTKHTARIVPIYPETDGLTSKQLRNIIMPFLPLLKNVPETLPEEVVVKAKLMSRERALLEIHAPSSSVNLKKARYRLGFEELFFIVAASIAIKSEIKTQPAPPISLDVGVAKNFIAQLDFELTNAQRAAAWQILQDMTEKQPMNRLLEGDVGSGKTVVAALTATMAIASGYQVALMVPTDILARQHYTKLGSLFTKLGYTTALLAGRMPTAAKKETIKAIADGNSQVVIGTHALLSEKVTFKNLGFVIIDEQHRFGVEQRQTLRAKATKMPHLLSMTATPIPRSLALTVYGDLDISIIDSMPPNRKAVATKLVKPKDRELAYQFVDKQIEEGRQMFVVCPLIEDSDVLGSKSVMAEKERLEKGPFKHRRIGLLHGRLAPADRDEVMKQFSDRKLDILVTTTVIEVGIDIPNATIILIEGAERFGLAALHQLRGRVGRGEHFSYCLLSSDSTAPAITERLQALERTHDGFRLAQIDLELRGPGQVYGQRQHGVLKLDFVDFADAKLLAAVRQRAAEFVADKTAVVKYPQITERINRLKTITSLD